MSIDSLQSKGMLPHTYKYVGLAVSLVCLGYAIMYHLTASHVLFESLHAPEMIFVAGLIIAVTSKESYEDERVREIRSYVHSMLSGMFIGYIFWEELGGHAGSMISELAAFLTGYLLIFYCIYYFDTDWILRNRAISIVSLVVILVVLIITFDWLWAA